jgi:ribosomal protein L11 methyltransferase
MAEIAEAGFDTFMETEEGFEAFAEAEKADHAWLEAIKEKYANVKPLEFSKETIEKQNWNKDWEKNVEPIIVEGQCLIRAAFHKIDKKFPYEIIITPKMSFGTGHHQTTYLMIQSQLGIDHQDKLVMDAGCGTGILSIMASKRGARKVEAFDIDEWSIENGLENAELNDCPNIRIRQGTIRDFIWPQPFDMILANINRNILLSEMKFYAGNLKAGGLLQLSGFYVSDIPELEREAADHGMVKIAEDEREQWATIRLRKGN